MKTEEDYRAAAQALHAVTRYHPAEHQFDFDMLLAGVKFMDQHEEIAVPTGFGLPGRDDVMAVIVEPDAHEPAAKCTLFVNLERIVGCPSARIVTYGKIKDLNRFLAEVIPNLIASSAVTHKMLTETIKNVLIATITMALKTSPDRKAAYDMAMQALREASGYVLDQAKRESFWTEPGRALRKIRTRKK